MGRKKGKQCGMFHSKSMKASHTLEWQTHAYEARRTSSNNSGNGQKSNSSSTTSAMDQPLSTPRSYIHNVNRPIVQTSHLRHLLSDRQCDDRLEYQRFRQRLFQVSKKKQQQQQQENKNKTKQSLKVVQPRNDVGWLLRHVNDHEQIKRHVLKEDLLQRNSYGGDDVVVDIYNEVNNHEHYQYDSYDSSTSAFILRTTRARRSGRRHDKERKEVVEADRDNNSEEYYEERHAHCSNDNFDRYCNDFLVDDDDDDVGLMSSTTNKTTKIKTTSDTASTTTTTTSCSSNVKSLVTLCVNVLSQPGIMEQYVLDCGYEIIYNICNEFPSSLLSSLSTNIVINAAANTATVAAAAAATTTSTSSMIPLLEEEEEEEEGYTIGESKNLPWISALMDHSHLERIALTTQQPQHDCNCHLIKIVPYSYNDNNNSNNNNSNNNNSRTEEYDTTIFQCQYCHEMNQLFQYLSFTRSGSSYASATTDYSLRIKKEIKQTHNNDNKNKEVSLSIIENNKYNNNSNNNNNDNNNNNNSNNSTTFPSIKDDVVVDDWEDFTVDSSEDDDDGDENYDNLILKRNFVISSIDHNTSSFPLKNLLRLELLDIPCLDPYVLTKFLKECCSPNMTHLRLSNVFHSSTGPQFLLNHLLYHKKKDNDNSNNNINHHNTQSDLKGCNSSSSIWNSINNNNNNNNNVEMEEETTNISPSNTVLLPKLELLDLSNNSSWLTFDLLQEFIVGWIYILQQQEQSQQQSQNYLERINVYGCFDDKDNDSPSFISFANSSFSTSITVGKGNTGSNSSKIYATSFINNTTLTTSNQTLSLSTSKRKNTVWIDLNQANSLITKSKEKR